MFGKRTILIFAAICLVLSGAIIGISATSTSLGLVKPAKGDLDWLATFNTNFQKINDLFTGAQKAGGINASGLSINGIPVGTSTDTYWSADGGGAGGITYAGPVTIGTTWKTVSTLAELTAAKDFANVVLNDSVVMEADLTITGNLHINKGCTITTTGYTLTINGPFSAGNYQVFAGSGTVAGLSLVNGKWFGATGDGTTDDYAKLQQAFDVQKNVFIPPGVYLLSANLHGYSNCVYYGEDRQATIKAADSYGWPYVFTMDGKSNWKIKDLVIDANKDGNGFINAYDPGTKKGLTWGTIISGINTSGSTDFEILGCEIKNASGAAHGINIYNFSKRGRVAHCYIHDNSGDGVDVNRDNSDIIIESNLFSNNFGIDIESEGIILPSTFHYNYNVSFINNIIVDTVNYTQNYGIDAWGTIGLNISGNIIKKKNIATPYNTLQGIPGGIMVTASAMVTISDNVLDQLPNSRYGAIWVTDRYDYFSNHTTGMVNTVKVTNNLIFRSAGGIVIDGASNVVQRDNKFYAVTVSNGLPYTNLYMANISGTCDSDSVLLGEGYQYATNAENMLANPYFDFWPDGAAAAPLSWIIVGAGASVAREATIVKHGSYSVALTRGGADCTVAQGIDHEAYKGRYVTFGVWTYATVANRVRIAIYDSVTGTTYSSYHTGDSTWQYLTVNALISATAGNASLYMRVDGGDTTGYFGPAGFWVGGKTYPIGSRYSLNKSVYPTTAKGTDATGTNVMSGSANPLGANEGFLTLYDSAGNRVYVPYWSNITP